ncbi:MAG: RnfABCDGE type electron transport complex subunit G [Bacteroidales bacterium]|nr:RnfABCDGE type electron transport complex subunit G [Bacteroidales bacterium]
MATKSTFGNMFACLFAVCLICSAILAGVYALTKEPIEKAAQQALAGSISKVLEGTPSEVQTVALGDKTYEYYTISNGNETAGYAIKSSAIGFGGAVKIMVGIRRDGVINNVSVIDANNETPGLGLKCQDEPFIGQWKGFDPSSKVIKVGKDGGDVDAITAATITSRAFSNAVAIAVEVFKTIRGEEADANTGASTPSNENKEE